MLTIREKFHEIGNWHNKITVAAGVAKAILREKTADNQDVASVKDMINRLTEIEKHAIGADKVLNELKNILYAIVDPDTATPKKK